MAALNRNSFWVSDSQLAGILLDTQNLNSSAKLSKTRDAEAVQLLLVGSAPSYRNALFDQCMQFLSMNAKNKIKEFSCKQRALYLFSFLPFLVLSSDARSTWQCLSWSSAPQNVKSPSESKRPHSMLRKPLKVFWFSCNPSHYGFLLSKNTDSRWGSTYGA